MTTREYDSVLADIEALCGSNLSTEEQARIGYFINRRARKAYDASLFWPRFLQLGEERLISSGGLLPYAETGLDTIGTLIRLHATEPYKNTLANEYVQWSAEQDGVQVTGYTDTAYSTATGYTISGSSTSPDIDGIQLKTQTATDPDAFVSTSSTFPLTTLSYNSGGDYWSIFYFTDASTFSTWQTPTGAGSTVPASDVEFFPNSNASGVAYVAATTQYGIYATYQAEFSTTYSSGSDIPGEWADYIVQGAYSDWLRSEGQQEKATLAEAEAKNYLDDELEKVSRQGGDVMNTRVVNHGTTQWRT